eukprot:g4989.t1
MPRPHLTTNDKLQAVLDGAVRRKVDENVGEFSTGKAQETYQRGRRLARLYGSNHGSEMVSRRLRSRARPRAQAGAATPGSASGSVVAAGPSVSGGLLQSSSLLAPDSLDSVSSAVSGSAMTAQRSSSVKQPVDLQLRQSSPFRTEVSPAHPWYVGYRNSTKAIPSNVFASASRYGFSGSLCMSQREQPQSTLPSASQPPAFLNPAPLRDEWAPKQSGSPMVWIEDSAYVNGSKLKHTNTHIVYGARHEASHTTGESWDKLSTQQPRRFKGLGRVYERGEHERSRLQGCLDRERRRGGRAAGGTLGFASQSQSLVGMDGDSLTGMPARASQSQMQSKSLRKGSAMLKYLPGNEHLRVEGGPSVQQDRRLKYWSSLTMVCSDEQNPEVAAEKLEKEKQDRLVRYQLKWKELKTLNKILRSSRKPNNEDLEELSDVLFKTASENPVMTVLSREQFTRILHNHYGAHASMTTKHMHRLFSSFDVRRKDRLDVRDLVGTLQVLRRPSESPEDKLRALFDRYDWHDRGSITLPELRSVFLTCTSSDEDKYQMLKHFNDDFSHLENSGQSAISLDDYEDMLAPPRSKVVQCFEEQLRFVQSFHNT